MVVNAILLNSSNPTNANYVTNLLVLHIQSFVFIYVQYFINLMFYNLLSL